MFDDLPERPLMLNQRKKRSPLFIAGSVLLSIAAFALLLFALFNIWVHQTHFLVEVSGDSMLNTVENGDLLYVREGKAARGDIVIISVKDYRYENGGKLNFSGDYIIKRLIAVEGDTVRWESGKISVKYSGDEEFTLLDEPYIRGRTPAFEQGVNEIKVGEGEIFFLGDNRGNSYDSTEIGCLYERDIAGVVPGWSLAIKSFTNFWESMRTRVAVHQ